MLSDVVKIESIKLIKKCINEGLNDDEIFEILNENLYFRKKGKHLRYVPLTWKGGKNELCKDIIEYIPSHEIYIEPFFGSGSVFFNKKPSIEYSSTNYREIINDLDSNVFIFFKVLRENFQELIDFLENIEYSNELHLEYKTNSENYLNLSDIQKAAYFYFNCTCSFGGVYNCGFGYSLRNNHNQIYHKFYNKMLNLKSFSERLKDSEIFNRDYTKIIEMFDYEKSFFYLDPPYKDTTGYKVDNINYEELASILKNIKGKFILSHYRDKFIEENFNNNKFRIIDLNHSVTISKCKDSNRESTSENRECIILNF